jgi:hypothetical protein
MEQGAAPQVAGTEVRAPPGPSTSRVEEEVKGKAASPGCMAREVVKAPAEKKVSSVTSTVLRVALYSRAMLQLPLEMRALRADGSSKRRSSSCCIMADLLS